MTTTKKAPTLEERFQHNQLLRKELAKYGGANVQLSLMLYQHEQLQRTINALLTRWANEMLLMISDRQEVPHDH